jgi:hypothetical protein
MYIVIIEPLYSQGVGCHLLATKKKSSVEKFRNELVKVKNSLDDLEGWVFYEYVYEMTHIDNDEVFGNMIHEHVYDETFKKLIKIDYNVRKDNGIVCDISALPELEHVHDGVSGRCTGTLINFIKKYVNE